MLEKAAAMAILRTGKKEQHTPTSNRLGTLTPVPKKITEQICLTT